MTGDQVPVPAAGAGRRPQRSRVRHGQASCADYGCARPACRGAARRARRRRDLERDQGLSARVESGPAAVRAAVLVRRGMSAQDIACASGIAVTLIRRLLRTGGGRPVRIVRATSEAVLGVPLPGPGRPPSPGRGLTCADAAAAVLAELAAEGWPATFLAVRLDTSVATVAAVRDGSRRRISVALDVRIHRLRAHLAATTPAAEGVRARDAARTRSRAAGPARSRRAPSAAA
ncbi:hypothetical protein [Kitasatospora sp. NPDC088346]|uniref:hypothetical protein n=1 Tax=Kitasatospora sp. NPDC088346 TaxID=3364073 RepID=UPI0037F58E16